MQVLMSGWKKLPGRLFSQNRDTVVDISRLTIKTFSTTSILPQGGGLGSKSPSKIEIPKGSIITRKSDMAYCQELVRKGDHDNYLCSLFSPQPVRELVWTIRALNLELSRIGDVVSQEAVGRMRYEFWKNAIDGAFKGQPPQLPVARALADVHSRFRLSKMWIRRLLKTREEYFLKSKFDTIKDLEQYGENTVASLIHLQLEALGVRDMQADQAARTIGQASAIATFLRSFPQLTTSKDNCFLPQELINKYNVDIPTIIKEKKMSPELQEAVFELATIGYTRLCGVAEVHMPNSPKASYPALIAAVPIKDWLERLEKGRFNVFDPRLQSSSSIMLPYKLWRASRKGTWLTASDNKQ